MASPTDVAVSVAPFMVLPPVVVDTSRGSSPASQIMHKIGDMSQHDKSRPPAVAGVSFVVT
jgi:hypothetical protein